MCNIIKYRDYLQINNNELYSSGNGMHSDSHDTCVQSKREIKHFLLPMMLFTFIFHTINKFQLKRRKQQVVDQCSKEA